MKLQSSLRSWIIIYYYSVFRENETSGHFSFVLNIIHGRLQMCFILKFLNIRQFSVQVLSEQKEE